jgi:hypothetical protein
MGLRGSERTESLWLAKLGFLHFHLKTTFSNVTIWLDGTTFLSVKYCLMCFIPVVRPFLTQWLLRLHDLKIQLMAAVTIWHGVLWWDSVCNNETVCNIPYREWRRNVTEIFLLHNVAIRGTLCNNFVTYRSANGNGILLQSVPRMAFCYIASPFAVRYITICYILSRCYIPCLINAYSS